LSSVVIALGSNVGDRESHLAFAIERLGSVLSHLRASTFHDTAPVGVGPQSRYLNAVVVGETKLSPPALMHHLLAIEQERGRKRPHPGAPRTLDLDLILYSTEVIDEPGLRVPHPRFRERLFVLEPLSEVAGSMVDPETGKTIDQLLSALRAS